MTEPVIEIDNVHKSFGGKIALDGVTLTVPRGSVLGLLGKNGAGKSTLLRCLLGLQRVDAGVCRIWGADSWTLDRDRKARLAYVPQEPSLQPWFSVKNIIPYTAAFYPKWNAGLVKELLTEWEIDVDKRVGALSVGQQQKLAIVLALGLEPDLLVMDEPAAALDPDARRKFLARILDIVAGQERTVVFSTHITSDLERVADTIAVLMKGRLAICQDLANLKESVVRLRLSSSRDFPTTCANVVREAIQQARPGAPKFTKTEPLVLRQQLAGSTALISVAGYDPSLDPCLASVWSAEVQQESLSLEEIFLELHHA